MMFHYPRSPDGHLANSVLTHNPISGPSILNRDAPPEPPFLTELERRGYDITTFRMTVQLRDDHPWIKRHAIIYPKAGGKPAKVDWIRWRGSDVTVFFMKPAQRRDGEPEFRIPFCSIPHGMTLTEVERLYQFMPAESPDWSPDALPPMFPEVTHG